MILILSSVVIVNKFYVKNNFEKLEKSTMETGYFDCNSYYLKKLTNC